MTSCAGFTIAVGYQAQAVFILHIEEVHYFTVHIEEHWIVAKAVHIEHIAFDWETLRSGTPVVTTFGRNPLVTAIPFAVPNIPVINITGRSTSCHDDSVLSYITIYTDSIETNSRVISVVIIQGCIADEQATFTVVNIIHQPDLELTLSTCDQVRSNHVTCVVHLQVVTWAEYKSITCYTSATEQIVSCWDSIKHITISYVHLLEVEVSSVISITVREVEETIVQYYRAACRSSIVRFVRVEVIQYNAEQPVVGQTIVNTIDSHLLVFMFVLTCRSRWFYVLHVSAETQTISLLYDSHNVRLTTNSEGSLIDRQLVSCDGVIVITERWITRCIVTSNTLTIQLNQTTYIITQ